ncbi:MAG TPA: AlkA N-terminal domain-containing protein [Actinospica sp.]|nr:AlkA N-terminal domain-containing protein [Actinospica sp.]
MANSGIQSDEHRYEAVRGRDPRFDGVFFIAVLTTGIYCRPSCPATTPKRENVRFFPSAAAAQAAGFRACRRCRPDAVPGSAEWNLRADIIGRAMRLINDGVIDREGVTGLAARLGYSERQVQRHLVAELGAGPLALARAQRAHTARVLLQTTRLPATDVAFAAGFASVRQFNDTIREIYASTPTELRDSARKAERGTNGGSGSGVSLRLAYREPYAREQIFDFIGARAIPGVEEMTGERGQRVYRRTLRFEGGPGIVEVYERASGGAWLDCRLDLADLRGFTTAIGRMRRLFDLDADPVAVAEYFAAHPVLGPLSVKTPGLRSPGAADAEEMAIRAVLGQQITVAAARTLAGKLVVARGEPLAEASGGLTRLFPAPEALAEADFAELGMPESRKSTLRTIGAALADGSVRLDPGADRDQAQRELLALRGIGPWTAGYLRMRALSDPDVVLSGDVVIKSEMKKAGLGSGDVESWHPWASYAIHYFWSNS